MDICLRTYPSSPTPYRYLNSGSWMGRKGAAQALLTVISFFHSSFLDLFLSLMVGGGKERGEELRDSK